MGNKEKEFKPPHYFKVGDKVIVNHDNIRCFGRVVKIFDNTDIEVEYEAPSFHGDVIENIRCDKRGYAMYYDLVNERMGSYMSHGFAPQVMHEDIWQGVALYIGERLIQ